MVNETTTSINSSVTLTTDLLAFLGSVAGTFALAVNYLTYRRDRSDIKVEIMKDRKIYNSPQYDPNKTYFVISAKNIGRRRVTINQAGWVFLKKNGGVIYSDSMIYGPAELEEGKSKDWVVGQDDVDFSEISYFAVYDAIGNTYKKYVASWYSRSFYWFLDKTKIRRKPFKKSELVKESSTPLNLS